MPAFIKKFPRTLIALPAVLVEAVLNVRWPYPGDGTGYIVWAEDPVYSVVAAASILYVAKPEGKLLPVCPPVAPAIFKMEAEASDKDPPAPFAV